MVFKLENSVAEGSASLVYMLGFIRSKYKTKRKVLVNLAILIITITQNFAECNPVWGHLQ